MLPQLGVVAIKTNGAFPLRENFLFFYEETETGKLLVISCLTVRAPATTAAGQVGTQTLSCVDLFLMLRPIAKRSRLYAEDLLTPTSFVCWRPCARNTSD